MTTRSGIPFELAHAGQVNIQASSGPEAMQQLVAQYGDDTIIPREAGGASPLMHTMLTWSGALIPNGGFDSRASRLANSLGMNVALPEQVFRPNGQPVPTIEAKAAGLIPPSETPEERQARFDREDIAIRPELASQQGGPGFDAPSAVIPGPEPTVQPGGESGLDPFPARQQQTGGGGPDEPPTTDTDIGATFQQTGDTTTGAARLRYSDGRWFRIDGGEITDHATLTALNEAFRNHPQFRENNPFTVTDTELDAWLAGRGEEFQATQGVMRQDPRLPTQQQPTQQQQSTEGIDPTQLGLPAERPLFWPRNLPYPPRGNTDAGTTPQDEFFTVLQTAAAGGYGSEFIGPAQQFLGQGQGEIVELPVGDGTATFIRQPDGRLQPFTAPGQDAGSRPNLEQQIVRDLVEGTPESLARAQQLFRVMTAPDPATTAQTALNLAQSPADAFSVSSILRGDISPRLDAGPIGQFGDQQINRVGPVADFVQSSLANFFAGADPFSTGSLPVTASGNRLPPATGNVGPNVVNPALQGATERDIENADILNNQSRQQGFQIPTTGPNAPVPGQTLGSPVNISPEAIALIEGAGLDVPTYLEFLQTRGGPALPTAQQQSGGQNTLINTILGNAPLGQPSGSLLATAGIPIPGAQTQRNLSPTEFGALQGLTQLAGISQDELERELRSAIPISRPALRRQPFPNLGIRV